MSREQAIERYILLRLRVEDINRLSFLVEALYDKTVQLPNSSPFSRTDLKDTVRTSFFGWFATLTDRDERAVYAFDPLLALFPEKRGEIITMQSECEACHKVLQQFRNNVAFHSRADLAAYIKARQALRQQNTFLDLEGARKGFHKLMAELVAVELIAIPELPDLLTKLGISRHPAFANIFRAAGNI